MREMRFIKKDGNSGVTDCAAIIATEAAPSRYQLADTPGYAVQVVTLTPEEEARVRAVAEKHGVALGAHEALGWLPADVLEGINDT